MRKYYFLDIIMKEYNLEDVCKRFLDDAYLDFSFNELPTIVWTFYPFKEVDGKFWTIEFKFNSILEFSSDTSNLLDIVRDSTNIFYTWIEELHDSSSKINYMITLEWGINYKIKCEKLSWLIHELTEDEYNWLYFNN